MSLHFLLLNQNKQKSRLNWRIFSERCPNFLINLNDGTKTTDTAAWRTNLKAIFDTDVLKYLAINTTIQN